MTKGEREYLKVLKARMDKTYSLIYVDYRSDLSGSNVNEIIQKGEYWDLTDEWYDEQKRDTVDEIIAQLTAPELAEAEDEGLDFAISDDLEEALRELIEDRDDSDPLKDLLRNTGRMEWRYNLTVLEREPAALLRAWGLPVTMLNLRTAQSLICDPEGGAFTWYGYADGPLMAALNASWGNAEAPDVIKITNGHLSFRSYCDEDERFEGTATLTFEPGDLEACDDGWRFDDHEPTFEKLDVKENILNLSARLSRRCA